jgi:hypothetical protein
MNELLFSIYRIAFISKRTKIQVRKRRRTRRKGGQRDCRTSLKPFWRPERKNLMEMETTNSTNAKQGKIKKVKYCPDFMGILFRCCISYLAKTIFETKIFLFKVYR